MFQMSVAEDIEMTPTRNNTIYTEPNSRPYESEMGPTNSEIHSYGTLGQDDGSLNGNRSECNLYET